MNKEYLKQSLMINVEEIIRRTQEINNIATNITVTSINYKYILYKQISKIYYILLYLKSKI